jgi:hypothetical protein
VNQVGGALSVLQGPGPWQSAGRAALSSGINQALHGDWNWQTVMASAVGAGVGAAAGYALQGSAIGNALGGVGSRVAAGFVGGVAGQWAGRGGRAQYSNVLASTLGNALGESIASANQPDVPPPVSAEEKQKILAMFEDGPDAPAGNGLRLGGTSGTLRLSASAQADWSAQLDRGIRDRATALSNFDAAAAKVWAAEDAQATARGAAAGLLGLVASGCVERPNESGGDASHYANHGRGARL